MAEQKSKRGTRTGKGSDGAAADDKPKRGRSMKGKTDTSVAETEAPEATEAAGEEVEHEAPEVEREEGAVEENGRPDERTVREELRSIVRESALEVLGPAARQATTAAAKYAVTKGPKLAKDTVAPKVKDTLGPKLKEAGGIKGLADQALSNAGPVGKVASKLGMGGKLVEGALGGGDESEADLDATGSGRRMPVQQGMDVAVPLQDAFAYWTQYEDYPKFMHRVDGVSQEDETHVTFTEKIWGFGRDFEAEIVEQQPYERIAWRSVSGLKHAGVVTFHELAPRLSRIEVTVDFKPESLFQKFGRGARFSKRAIRADMHRFKAYVELQREADDEVGWLGRIEDGEVVESDEEVRERLAAEGQPEAEEREEPEAEEREAEEGEEPEAEEGEEPEAESPVATEPVADEPEEEEPEAEEEEPEAEAEEPDAEEEEEPEAEEPEAEEEEEPEEEPAGRRRKVRRRAPASPSRQRR